MKDKCYHCSKLLPWEEKDKFINFCKSMIEKNISSNEGQFKDIEKLIQHIYTLHMARNPS